MKIVLVEWVDSCTLDAWVNIEDTEKVTARKCLAAGFLTKEDDDVVVLSTLASNDGNKIVASLAIIPKVCVTRKIELQEVDFP